jgi:hypothetical protein
MPYNGADVGSTKAISSIRMSGSDAIKGCRLI